MREEENEGVLEKERLYLFSKFSSDRTSDS